MDSNNYNVEFPKYLQNYNVSFIFQTTLPFLITPFPPASIKFDEPRKEFSADVSGMRAIVEDVIGCWKSKWRCLRNGLRFRKVEKCSKFIQILAAISNFVLEHDKEERLSVQNFSIDDLEPRVLNEDDVNQDAHADYEPSDESDSDNEDSDHDSSNDEDDNSEDIPELDENEQSETEEPKRKKRKRDKAVQNSDDSDNDERETKEPKRKRKKHDIIIPTNEQIFQKYYAGL